MEGVLSSRSFLQMLSESKKSMSKKHIPWESHARFLVIDLAFGDTFDVGRAEPPAPG